MLSKSFPPAMYYSYILVEKLFDVAQPSQFNSNPPVWYTLGMKDIAILKGYDQEDKLVYESEQKLVDFYEEDQIFDNPLSLVRLGIVRVDGELFDNEKKIKEFRTYYTEEGKYSHDEYDRHFN